MDAAARRGLSSLSQGDRTKIIQSLCPPLSLFVSRLMTCLSQSVVGGVVLTVGDLAPFTKPLMQPTAVNNTYWKVNAETTQLRCLD